MHTCTHVSIHTYAQKYADVSPQTDNNNALKFNTHTHTRTHTYVCIHVRICLYTHTRKNTLPCPHKQRTTILSKRYFNLVIIYGPRVPLVLGIPPPTPRHTHTHTPTQWHPSALFSTRPFFVSTSLHLCVRLGRMCVYTRTHARTYVHTHTYMYMRTHTHTHLPAAPCHTM